MIHYSSFSAETESLESEKFGRFLSIYDKKTERSMKYVIYSRAFLSPNRISRETGIPLESPSGRIRFVNIRLDSKRISSAVIGQIVKFDACDKQ